MMKGVLSFLLVLLFFVPVIVGIVGGSEIQQEKAEIRSIWEQMLRDMAAEGYLSPSVKDHYTSVLQKMGYEQDTPFFIASHTSASNRAPRPQHGVVNPQNEVKLTIAVKPRRWVQALSFLKTGEMTFTFTGTRISEYIQ